MWAFTVSVANTQLFHDSVEAPQTVLSYGFGSAPETQGARLKFVDPCLE